uniref:Uncharacterized protein n=1 Tax=Rhizophora mucronata TaxID=61149 RepID=A0A2P2J517_RHIMU
MRDITLKLRKLRE